MVSLIVRNKNREPIKSKCQSLFGKLSRSSSHSNMSRMENDLKMVEENTSKFEKSIECINWCFRTIYKKLENVKTKYQRNLQNRKGFVPKRRSWTRRNSTTGSRNLATRFLSKCWFGLVWRNRSKNLEFILGLNIGFFLFDRVHNIRGFCSSSIGVGLLRTYCPYRNSRD